MDSTGSILIADDHKTMRLTLSGFVKSHWKNFTPLFAETGDEAVSLATKHTPNVVLMDLNMPNLDGCEAIRQLRDGGFENPIIVVSAENNYPTILKALKAGCDDYLLKPVDFHVLNDKLKKSLTNKKERYYPVFPYKNMRIVNLNDVFDPFKFTKTLTKQIGGKSVDLVIDSLKSPNSEKIVEYLSVLPPELNVKSVRVVLDPFYMECFIDTGITDVSDFDERIGFHDNLDAAIGDSNIKVTLVKGHYQFREIGA